MRRGTIPRLVFGQAIACAAMVLSIAAHVPTLAGNVTATATALAPSDNPDFDSVTWTTLACGNGVSPQGDVSPSSADIVGDAAHPGTYYALDPNYLYFRFRVDISPTGSRGFDQYAWVSLMQVPSGDAFQYQYELALNGKGSDDDFGNTGGQQGDTIEIWRNATAENVDFTPMFNDPAETRLFSQRYDYSGPGTANTTWLARIVAATDGSSFGGNADYFVDFAIPISVLIAKGAITGISDVANSLFFPATSANANQYNKDRLPCPFLPYTTLSITKSVAPTAAPTNASTSLVHTITVANVGQAMAKGVVISDTAFPATVTGITVQVSSNDPTVTWTIITTNPLSIRVPRLPTGKSVSIEIDSTATFTCASPDFVNTATAGATNALENSATATLTVGEHGLEICDGRDNDCDGIVDEGPLCDDGNACNGVEACVAGSCRAGTPLSCSSNNQCVSDSCNPATGCVHTNKPNGTSCNDVNACTQTDTCQAGACVGASPVACTASDPCHVAGTCNPMTGTCSNPNISNGASCNDGNACTQTDTCQGGACVGAGLVVCTASDPCHVAGTCDPATGTCSNPNKSNGASCSDDNLCTQADTCQNGACVGANPVLCTASDPCHVAGVCDPTTGACSNPTKDDGSACNDGNACTQSDTCQSGACVGESPVVCTASDQCHVAGTCDPATGTCSNPNKSNDSSCSDGNACTRTDTCQNGSCVGANLVECTASDQCHVAGTCDPATGTCSDPDKSNGSSCSDDNACTQTDTCHNGSCLGENPVLCTASDQCHIAGTCDTATGTCSNPTKDDGTSCSDGNACTQIDTCQAGACVGASPVECTASDQCHVAGTCDPATGTCSNPNKSNGASCDDGNACTQIDTCQGGACVGASPVVCTASDQCHVAGTCDPATGTCSNPNKSNGSSCSDGNACTQTDTCQGGACVGASPVACTASDQCHVAGSCDPATGTCSNPNKSNGSSCSDGNACTQIDTCQAGACVGASPVECTASDQCHVAGTCDPATGTCSNPNKSNGASCDDGNACTQTDTCQGGACVGASPVVCTASDQCHVAGICDPATGACSNPNKSNGSSCSDGNACTQTDTCHNGSCVGANPVLCTASDQCHIAGTCDTATGICSNPTKDDGTSCSDGNACTQIDTCQAGACVGASPVVCTASDPCHVAGTCDPATGTCSNPNKSNGASCDDGNACTQTDTCQGGACVGASPVVCTASDQCHVAGTCDPATGACSNPNKSNGSSCSDGNACTQTDTCQGGACVGASPVVCTASDQCHVAGTCNPTTGTCSNPAKDDGSACNDGNACTQTDACQGGACVGASPVVCTASDQCHVAGTCDPATGVCSNPNKSNGSSCSDGNACTRTDTCQNGGCVGANPVECTASDQCHVAGVCEPTTGTCSNPNKSNGASCSDGNACTQTDTCQNGSCVGVNPVLCTASDQCHVAGTCDTATGTCSNPTRANGTSCADGNGCTQTDTCQSGTCTGTNPVLCTASDQCHVAGTCNTATGVCSNPSKPNGTGCNDGNACTRTDTCQSGTCTGANPVTCTASDQCHLVGVCNTSTGICPDPMKSNGSSCSDGNACTSNDTCQSGVCTAGPPTQCNDANVCTDDGCVPATGCWHTPNSGPCNDGNVCTSQDTCANTTCVGGPLSWADCSAPHSIGHYKHSCSDPSDDPIGPADIDCVNDWSTFASVTTVAQVCQILNGSGDKCRQAEAQFMAALLNLCKHRLALAEEIISRCGENTTVAQSLNEANTILSNPARTQADCARAQCESEELDSGDAVTGIIVLFADRMETSVRVRWYPPANATAASYKLWRRVRGVGSFVIITTTPSLTYDDTQVIDGVNYEYQVTAN